MAKPKNGRVDNIIFKLEENKADMRIRRIGIPNKIMAVNIHPNLRCDRKIAIPKMT
jgi:hypothetical protein